MTVDPGFARWLREGALWTPADNATVLALYAAIAREVTAMSPLALKTGADAEAARQVAFLGGPLVIDTHLVPGARVDLIGQCVTIVADRLDYQAGVAVFVIGAAEADKTDQTVLTVLRKLT